MMILGQLDGLKMGKKTSGDKDKEKYGIVNQPS